MGRDFNQHGWLGGLVLVLSEAGARGWGGPVVLTGAIMFAVLLPAFAVRQWRAEHPLVHLALLKDHGFTFGTAAALFNTLGRFGNILLIALFLQAVSGLTPAQAGLAVLPGPLAAMIAAPAGGFLGRVVRPRTIAVAGSVLAGAGLLLMLVLLDAGTSYWVIALCLMLVAAGSGLFTTGNTAAVLAVIPSARLGIATCCTRGRRRGCRPRRWTIW